MSQSLTDEWEINVTFWGTKYFRNILGIEVPLGAKLKQPILRQVNGSDAEQIEITEDIYVSPLVIASSFALLVAFCGGRLLPTWMFLNSMQLILHLILIRTDIPSHAHLFMFDMLNKLRLKSDWTDELATETIGDPAQSDYEVAQESVYFSQHIKSCGYHYNWLNNLFIVLLVSCLIFLVWLCLMLKDYIVRRYFKRDHRHEAFMANFSIRFMYEVVFEICLASILYLTLANKANSFVLFLCIITVLAILASLIFCLSRGFKNGPYVHDCYEKGTLMRSFWAVRPIN